jgi:hypothetical protein
MDIIKFIEKRNLIQTTWVLVIIGAIIYTLLFAHFSANWEFFTEGAFYVFRFMFGLLTYTVGILILVLSNTLIDLLLRLFQGSFKELKTNYQRRQQRKQQAKQKRRKMSSDDFHQNLEEIKTFIKENNININ